MLLGLVNLAFGVNECGMRRMLAGQVISDS